MLFRSKTMDSVKGSMELTDRMVVMLKDEPIPAIFTALQYNTIKTIYDMTDDEQEALAYAARFTKMLVSGIEHMYDLNEEADDEDEDLP